MPANITINGAPGSDTDLPINVLVQLNTDVATTYTWAILDQPEGAADALSAVGIQNPTFTPRKEGTYLLRLIADLGLGSESRQTVVAAVRHLKSRRRIPAAGEVAEADLVRGWATDANRMLTDLDDAETGRWERVVCVADEPGLARGDVVYCSQRRTLKAGLPGEEYRPGVRKALASTANVLNWLGVLEGDVDGNPNPAADSAVVVRAFGRFGPTAGVPTALLDPVYATDTGVLGLTPGTNRRQVGVVVQFGGGTFDTLFGPVPTDGLSAVRQAVYVPLPNTQALGTAQPLPLADVQFAGKVTGGSLAGAGATGVVASAFGDAASETGVAATQAGLGGAAAANRPYPTADYPAVRQNEWIAGRVAVRRTDGDEVPLRDMLTTAAVPDQDSPVYGFLSRRTDLAADNRWRLWFYFRRRADGLEVPFTPDIAVTTVVWVPEVFSVLNLPVGAGLDAPFATGQVTPTTPDEVVLTRATDEAIAIGEPVAIDTGTGNLVKARAAAASNPYAVGVALQTAGGAGVVIQAQLGGDVNVSGAGLTVGRPVYLTPAGGYTSTPPVAGAGGFVAGDFRVFLGMAKAGGASLVLQPSEPEILA